nr:immunoglobulin light chain junction region [Macaca mulatta]
DYYCAIWHTGVYIF